MNITCIKQSGESRVLFEGYTKSNDINPANGKIGIRCHHWFIAFFMRIFGMITNIKASDGKIYHLNKKEYNDWRRKQASALRINVSDPQKLPAAEEIILRHNKVIQKARKAKRTKKAVEVQSKKVTSAQSAPGKEGTLKATREKCPATAPPKKIFPDEAAALKARHEAESALTFQRHIRIQIVHELLPELKCIKDALDGLKNEKASLEKDWEATQAKYLEEIEAFSETIISLENKIKIFKQEISEIKILLVEKKQSLKKISFEIKSKQARMAQVEEEKISEQGSAPVAFIRDFLSLEPSPKIEELTGKINEFSNGIHSLQTSCNALHAEVSALSLQIQNRLSKISDYQTQISNLKLLEQNKKVEHEACLNELKDKIDLILLGIEKKNAEYDTYLVKMNGFKPPSMESSSEIKVEETPLENNCNASEVVPTMYFVENEGIQESEPSPIEMMYADIKANAHRELVKVMQAIVNKFGTEAITTWEFNAETGNFKVILDKTRKLWVRPTDGNGIPSSKTPKGIVILYGKNDSNSIEGHLDKKTNTIKITQGLAFYCEYTKVFGFIVRNGIGDATINKFSYLPDTRSIEVELNITDRSLNLGAVEVERNKLKTMLKDWNAGIIPPDNHEGFLSSNLLNR